MQTWEEYYAQEEAIAEAEEMLDLLSEHYPGPDTERQVKRGVYKYTNCGAWVAFPSEGALRVELGSIVEGSDYGTETHVLKWPFTIFEKHCSRLRALDHVLSESKGFRSIPPILLESRKSPHPHFDACKDARFHAILKYPDLHV